MSTSSSGSATGGGASFLSSFLTSVFFVSVEAWVVPEPLAPPLTENQQLTSFPFKIFANDAEVPYGNLTPAFILYSNVKPWLQELPGLLLINPS